MTPQRESMGFTGQAPFRSALGALLVVALGACDSMLEVELPGNLTEDDLYLPASAEILVNSAIADFECAFSMYTAVMSGAEDATWRTSGYFTTSTTYQSDRPAGGGCTTNIDTSENWFQGFQKSRLLAENSYTYLTGWTDAEVANRTRLLATAAVYAGLFYSQIGEVYCEFALPGEALMTPMQTLQRAEQWFTVALGHIGSGDYSIVSTTSLKQLAYLLRARVRLAMRNTAGAAADAALVAPGFAAWVTREPSVRPRWNAVYQAFNATRWRSFAGPVRWLGHLPTQLVSTGYIGLTIKADGRPGVNSGTADPRVKLTYTGQFAQDGVTDQYTTSKYTGLGDDQRLASWAEAQYILAEIEGGQATVARINAVRVTKGITTAFVSADNDEIYSVLIEERRREFFLEGRHHADKLRYGLWFPRLRGWNHKAVRYGSEYCLLMPESAYNLNPLITAGFIGPDLSNLSYDFQLKVARVARWPVPSSLP
ncbi:MAG: hypothetical protein EXR91_12400 [Gemmatimonadetes bacterium]|nr:hypothetical protein [Gemmatimonadota bacterium]